MTGNRLGQFVGAVLILFGLAVFWTAGRFWTTSFFCGWDCNFIGDVRIADWHHLSLGRFIQATEGGFGFANSYLEH